jgi:hypothetical protein
VLETAYTGRIIKISTFSANDADDDDINDVGGGEEEEVECDDTGKF